MRLIICGLLALATSLAGAEPKSTAEPIWNGAESLDDYAKRVQVPRTQTLSLSGGVKMELVLIPAGRFVMGTVEPKPVDETRSHTIFMMQVLFVVLLFVIFRVIRQRKKEKFSAPKILLLIVGAGVAFGCALYARKWERELTVDRALFAEEKALFVDCPESEKPGHAVLLTKPFYMGKFEVTQEQYEAVVGMNPVRFKGKTNPIEMMASEDAQAFCRTLTEQSKHTVRLPTEAEWEYACRAGTTTAFYSGNSEDDWGRTAWFETNSNGTTHPVGQKEANAFGLFDMHGNVWEWCQDRWDENYYRKSVAEDPTGPAEGTVRSVRGGSYGSGAFWCRSAHRDAGTSDGQYPFVGFRVVMSVSP